jgi:hypothetical protein
MFRHARAAAIGVTMLIGFAAATHSAGNAAAWAEDEAAVTVPWLETRAPQAFTSKGPQGRLAAQATYRIDAEVVLPLGIGSIRLASRRDVGRASVRVHDYQGALGPSVRAYEFVAFSFPERAQNQDRTGFMWEVRAQSDRAGWSAYLGGMTRSPNRRTLEAELGQATRQYEVIDGLISTSTATSRVYRVQAGPRRTVPAELYADLRPLLVPKALRRTDKVDEGSPLPTLGFLAALDETLRLANGAAAVPRLTQRFVYSRRLRALELDTVERDAPFGRTLAQSGAVKDPAAVHELSYRITVDREEVSDFTIWIERRPSTSPDGGGLTVPVAFELRPRSFLRLRGVRTS